MYRSASSPIIRSLALARLNQLVALVRAAAASLIIDWPRLATGDQTSANKGPAFYFRAIKASLDRAPLFLSAQLRFIVTRNSVLLQKGQQSLGPS